MSLQFEQAYGVLFESDMIEKLTFNFACRFDSLIFLDMFIDL